jgi:hypothetical protein
MKTFVTAALAATLFAVPAVFAQNAPTAKNPSPNSVNTGGWGKTSGHESEKAAGTAAQRVAGSGKYCAQKAANGPLDCRYVSMAACKSGNKATNFQCVVNPKIGTTGSR